MTVGIFVHSSRFQPIINYLSPASKAKQLGKVANLTERKNPPTPVHCVKELSSVCLSVCDEFRPQLYYKESYEVNKLLTHKAYLLTLIILVTMHIPTNFLIVFCTPEWTINEFKLKLNHLY